MKEEPVQTKKNVSSSIVVKYKQEGSENKSIDYSCEVYFPVEFTKLRKLCDISPDDYCQSLARSKGFDAKGGKSGASFSKTFDDRFILKKISKNELDSFIEFADQYFFYFFKEVSQRLVPTALAKIFGIYSLTYRGNTTTFNNYFIVVMENLFYKRNITKIFDLKGSMRNRHSMDQTSILLDEDLLERMYEYPMCLQQKGKADLGMAVWNDSVFLARLNVMDYSLLVGIDEENGEYVVGIIDYLRKYGWDKQFESWVKKTGMLAGGKVPTIISPKQYEKRFQYAIWLYFLMVPSKGLQFVNDLTEESTKKMS
uniref:PIPK domain-containing protein n=1 Tax=Arcella intermedia TaxID=1963864 RepID=A0A6B2LA48_9EUKA